MAAVVIIGDGCGLRIEARSGNQPNKSKLLLYKLLTFLLNGCTKATRSALVRNVDVGHGQIKVLNRRAGLGYR